MHTFGQQSSTKIQAEKYVS